MSVALANSTGFYAWQPNQETIFRFESQQLSGISEIANQWAGLKLTSEVIVQSFSDYSLRIAFKNPKFAQVNQKLQVVDGKPVVPAATQELPETLAHALKTRGLKRGIASLCIGGGEATAIAIESV